MAFVRFRLYCSSTRARSPSKSSDSRANAILKPASITLQSDGKLEDWNDGIASSGPIAGSPHSNLPSFQPSNLPLFHSSMSLNVTPGQFHQRAHFYDQLGQLSGAGLGVMAALDMLQRKPPAPSYRRPI